jgi:hypothetical protein
MTMLAYFQGLIHTYTIPSRWWPNDRKQAQEMVHFLLDAPTHTIKALGFVHLRRSATAPGGSDVLVQMDSQVAH